MNLFNKKTSNRGFTIIELLVTISVLAILVLLGAPRLLSYTQKAELTRIQHDTKVMEQEMKIVLLENEGLEGFDYNAKDLGLLIEANRLFEKEGYAEGLEYIPAEGEINGLSKKERKISSRDNSEVIGVGGVEYPIHDELGVGGNEVKIEEEKEFKEIYERYKIVPDNYKDKIKTRLKGTFYTNKNGKVYYEPDKPNKIKTEPKVLNCDVALPDYEFEPTSGKIVKWHGAEQHLIIPSHFLVDGKCWPVRIIGEGAFMQGGFKSIMIPPSVLIIERNAFKESGVDSISIPGSVREIGQGAFDGVDEVVYLGGPSRVNNGSGPGTYLTPDGSSKNIVHRYPSAGEANVVFHPESGTIVRGSNKGAGVYIPEYIRVGGRDVRVRKVAKGAYQGLGLITIILPETLEIIEDYAFSGNQLIGVTIPNSVYHIGHYAFSFNEVWHEDSQNDRKATIKTVIIKEEEQFEEIDKVGNIVKDGVKVNLLEANSGELGPDVKLLNHIWVTSIGNIVIDVKYGPVGSEEPGIPTEPKKEPEYSDKEIQDLIEEGYIPIATASDLNNIRSTSTQTYGEGTKWEKEYAGGLGNKYVQVDNIDLSEYSKGKGWTPIGNNGSRFTGSFDGNGYNITGLTINRSTTDYVGLFGYTEGATIENVALEEIKVTGKSNVGGLVGVANNSTIENSYATGSVTGTSQVGGLVGQAEVSTKISNSYATGSVTGKSNVGGLVGYANRGTISNSYATGSVEGTGENVGGLVGQAEVSTKISNSYATGSVTGSSSVGGFVGYANRGTISNSYATGSVTGSWYVGGLVGYANRGTISNSYAMGNVTGSSGGVGGLVGETDGSTISNSYATGEVTGGRTGGLVGYAYSGTTISNSYWDTVTTRRTTSAGGGTGKTTVEMKKKDTYLNSGWEFDEIWEIDEGVSYPTLINNPERH